MALASRHMAAACAGIMANVLLGLSALFWKTLGALPPLTLLTARIIASLAALLLIMGTLGRLRALAQRVSQRDLAIHVTAAILLACNWLTFIWESIQGHVVESGLGYLLAPFVAIAAGCLVFGETMSRTRLVAVLVYHQTLSATSALCFGLICLALLLMLCEPVLARIVGAARGNRQDAG